MGHILFKQNDGLTEQRVNKMRLSYAHRIPAPTKRDQDISQKLLRFDADMEEIGGWPKEELHQSVARFARWLFDDMKAGEDIEIEVYRGDNLSMVTVIGTGFAIGWESRK